MRLIRTLFLCLFVASLVTTATVHAQESPGSSRLECSGMVHSDGDSDQPEDGGKVMPHHHAGCHSWAGFLPSEADETSLFRSGLTALSAHASTVINRWSIGPGLRPPIA